MAGVSRPTVTPKRDPGTGRDQPGAFGGRWRHVNCGKFEVFTLRLLIDFVSVLLLLRSGSQQQQQWGRQPLLRVCVRSAAQVVASDDRPTDRPTTVLVFVFCVENKSSTAMYVESVGPACLLD